MPCQQAHVLAPGGVYRTGVLYGLVLYGLDAMSSRCGVF